MMRKIERKRKRQEIWSKHIDDTKRIKAEYEREKEEEWKEYINSVREIENEVVKDVKAIIKLMINNRGKLFSVTELANEAKTLNTNEIRGILLAMAKSSNEYNYCSRFFRNEYHYWNKVRDDIRKSFPEFTVGKKILYPSTISITMFDDESNKVEFKRPITEREKKQYSTICFRIV